MIPLNRLSEQVRPEKEYPEAETRVYSWTVPDTLPYFEGHFPDLPVLPAVAVVDCSLELLQRQRTATGSPLKGIESAKFLKPISPGLQMEIRLVKIGEKRWEVEWRGKSEAEKYAKLSFLF